MNEPPTLVLLHGFTNTGASWQPVIRALGERYRAIAPDIRGHGSATDTRPVTLDAVIADVAGLTGDGFTLVGYSMGGRIALNAALALPSRVERLVLIGASPGLHDPGERNTRRDADERLAGQIEQSDIESFARGWAQTPILAGLPAELAQEVHQDRLKNTPHGLAAALRGLGTGTLPSRWDELHNLAMPVTLIVGERDVKYRSIADQMAARIPEPEVRTIPGAGHAAHIERPAVVSEILKGG
ncbi:MAG TPA: 2-succinyl-6-hydroxy-2,4-cyclohexadiene-1-carboxylate synthase [Solirubrobacteraceae bacterium]|jgi:2-succinyl-6-hydroxy-2,4-cyclohexadiene-1-carboxylate synthase|nr:2-succinyl-6-hydroxy-2,4-cyclohexadiene-1-carboxylate synthase [Solirubrobacteraceae bacterium]